MPRWHPDLPTRFAVVPRRGSTDDIRWFEADPTYVLHWVNAYEDGDEIVLDGFFQGDPMPAADGETDRYKRAFRGIDTHRMQTRLHRWRFNLATGATQGRDAVRSDHGVPDDQRGSTRGRPYRYSYNMTTQPGWFLFDGIVKVDLDTGAEERYAFGDGVFGSETPMAPARRRDRRGRRLPRHVHHRHERRPLRVPRARRCRHRSRPDRAHPPPRAHL